MNKTAKNNIFELESFDEIFFSNYNFSFTGLKELNLTRFDTDFYEFYTSGEKVVKLLNTLTEIFEENFIYVLVDRSVKNKNDISPSIFDNYLIKPNLFIGYLNRNRFNSFIDFFDSFSYGFWTFLSSNKEIKSLDKIDTIKTLDGFSFGFEDDIDSGLYGFFKKSKKGSDPFKNLK